MNIGLIYLLIYLISIGLIRFGLSKLFIKAGEEGWKAFVPVLSDIVWVKLIGKPIWWAVLCFIPMARTLVKVQMRIDLAKVFNRHNFWEQVAAVLFPFIYFPYIGNQPTGELPTEPKKKGLPIQPIGTVYCGPDPQKYLPPRSAIREWGDAILYAGSAAMIIRTLYFEAFVIPTTSMERTLMAGDFLFVSKFHYGCRTPMVPLAFPFVHNQLPFVGGKSYIPYPKLPYYRLPGLSEVKRNDIVVFNYPAHDIDDSGIIPYGKIAETSMKENYIKRCVGMPGDVIEVRDHQVYINNAPGINPTHMQFKYLVRSKEGFNADAMRKMGFRVLDKKTRQADYNNCDFVSVGQDSAQNIVAEASAPNYLIDKVKALPNVNNVGYEMNFKPTDNMPGIYPSNYSIPQSSRNKYDDIDKGYHAFSLEHNNVDNFGPLKIPKKGEAITLTGDNYRLYYRCITAYEGRSFEAKDNKFFIDGKESNQYIPQMNYYIMMGDNRHNSEDSRFWGFVPEDHIVGTPIFIFFSTENFFNPSTWRLGRIGTGCIK